MVIINMYLITITTKIAGQLKPAGTLQNKWKKNGHILYMVFIFCFDLTLNLLQVLLINHEVVSAMELLMHSPSKGHIIKSVLSFEIILC